MTRAVVSCCLLTALACPARGAAPALLQPFRTAAEARTAAAAAGGARRESEQRLALRERQLAALAGPAIEVSAQLARMTEEERIALDELARGDYCSKCRRCASEIEAAGEEFEAHLARDQGMRTPPPPEAKTTVQDRFARRRAGLEADRERLRRAYEQALEQVEGCRAECSRAGQSFRLANAIAAALEIEEGIRRRASERSQRDRGALERARAEWERQLLERQLLDGEEQLQQARARAAKARARDEEAAAEAEATRIQGEIEEIRARLAEARRRESPARQREVEAAGSEPSPGPGAPGTTPPPPAADRRRLVESYLRLLTEPAARGGDDPLPALRRVVDAVAVLPTGPRNDGPGGAGRGDAGSLRDIFGNLDSAPTGEGARQAARQLIDRFGDPLPGAPPPGAGSRQLDDWLRARLAGLLVFPAPPGAGGAGRNPALSEALWRFIREQARTRTPGALLPEP